MGFIPFLCFGMMAFVIALAVADILMDGRK